MLLCLFDYAIIDFLLEATNNAFYFHSYLQPKWIEHIINDVNAVYSR